MSTQTEPVQIQDVSASANVESSSAEPGGLHFEELPEESGEQAEDSGEEVRIIEPDSEEKAEEVAAEPSEEAEETPKASKYAELVRQQKELLREKEALAHGQAQLNQYIENLRNAMSSPDTAARLLESMGIDVNKEVGKIARAKLGLEEEVEPQQDLSGQLLNKIAQLESKLSEVAVGYQEAGLRRTTERHVSRALASLADNTPFLTEAIKEDPDIVDKIVETAVKSQRAGKNVDIVRLIQESEAIVERDVKAAYSWSLKNPRLRQELRAMLDTEDTPAAAKKPTGKRVSPDDKVSLASREPAGAQGDLTPEDLDRMMMEEALGRA